MTLSPLMSAASIAVAAAATFATRLIPHVLFGGNRPVPRVVNYLGKMLPPAIIATLVVYCLRNVDFLGQTHGLPEIIAVIAVAALHIWKKNTLLSIGAGTALYMVLIHFMGA